MLVIRTGSLLFQRPVLGEKLFSRFEMLFELLHNHSDGYLEPLNAKLAKKKVTKFSENIYMAIHLNITC